MIKAIDRILELVNEDTKLIPGHGPLASLAELWKYRQMLQTVGERICVMVEEGKSKAEVIATKPTRKFDEEWGGGFLRPDQWAGIVYDGMVKK